MTPRRALLGVGLLGFGGLAVLAALYFQLTLVMGPCTGPSCGGEAQTLGNFREVVRSMALAGGSLLATGLLILGPALRPAPRERTPAPRLPTAGATVAARAAATVTLAVRDPER